MFSNSRYVRRFFMGAASVLATGLLTMGLASCGGSTSSGNGSGGNSSAPLLTLSPSSIKLTAAETEQQPSLLLSASAGTGAATVTVSGLPAGVSISPATLSLTPGTALPLTLTAAASAATSTATVSFTTTIAGQAVSTQGSLSVQAAPAADFSLSVMPASVSLTSNGTASTVSVLATAVNGFSGSVAVAISGLPSGVTAQPSSLTLTPGTAATLSLTAAAGTAAGSATATLTGKSGALTHSASLAISVVAPPPAQADFSLAVSPQSLSLAIGAAGKPVQLSATALNGFTGTVSVALSGLPAGVTASPATLTLTPGTPQSVTLAAGNNAAAGSANLVFTGTSGVKVTTYHNDNARDGWYQAETVLTPQNVNATAFGKLTELPVDGKVDAQPLYVSGLAISGQTHNVLIVVTENDSAYAFDPDSGTQLWKVSAAETGETPSDDHGCGQITPTIGITDTPVIDRSQGPNGAVYFVAMSKDASNNYHQRLHALDLATGAELAGSPSEIQAAFPGTGYGSTNGMQVFDPGQYAERVGLLLMNGQLYLAWTSHCDDDPYTGWIMAYSETTLQQTSVLNVTPNGPSTPHFGNGEGSVWMAGSGLAGDTQGNIYFLDANGSFDSSLNANGFPAQGDFGNSFMKVSTTGNVLAAADYFAAYNLQNESDADQDLGSGGAMLLPDLVDANGTTRHLAVGAGKDTNIYVVDRDNMGKFNASSNNAVYQELPNAISGAFSMAALFNNTVYYASNGDHLKAFPITNALLATTPASESATSFPFPGATPSVSSNGAQNGIVWAIENQGGAGVLHAYDTTNLPSELYDSNQAPNNRDHFSDNKFVPPMIANGKVLVGEKKREQ